MMKSTRLIILGLVLLLAGVAGFSANLSQERAAQQADQGSELDPAGGFRPMIFALDSPSSAPTLAPTPKPALLPEAPITLPEMATPTTTPSSPLIPDRIQIPKIELDAPILPAGEKKVEIEKKEFVQFLAPDQFAAGWHSSSAPLGEAGNTVLNGHHNVYGKVFGRLVELAAGDKIFVYSGASGFEFQVANILILPERDATLETRLENARWIEPSSDVRLTLVTCWPEYSNTHRLIIVASLVGEVFQKATPEWNFPGLAR